MGQLPDRTARRWLLGHLLTLVLAGLVLAYANRNQWFFGDEWEFLGNRGIFHGASSVWVPHSEHWSTIPIIVYIVLRDTFGLGSYWPFIVVLIATHLCLTHVLWRVTIRAGVARSIATAGALVFALLGAGYENLLWAFQLGFIGSLLFGWAAALVADIREGLSRRDVGVVALLIMSLMCSGIGVPMVAVVALIVLLRSRNWVRTVVVAGVPAAVFLVWYRLIGSIYVHSPTGGTTVDSVVREIRGALVQLAKDVTGVPGALVKVLLVGVGLWWIAMMVWAVRGRASVQTASIALAGPTGAVLFVLMVALGRTGLGASRYVYVVSAMAFPALLLAVSAAARRPWLQGVAVAGLAALMLPNLMMLRTMSITEGVRERWIRETVTAAAHIVGERDDFLGQQVEPVLDPDIFISDLRRFVAKYGLPDSPVTVEGTNNALLYLEVAITSDIGALAGASAPELAADTSGVTASSAGAHSICWSPAEGAAVSHVVLTTNGLREAFTLDAPDGAIFYLQLGSGADISQTRTLAVSPGEAIHVLTDLPSGTALRVGLPIAGSSLCEVR